MNILVSACLLGVSCRYDGTGKYYRELTPYMKTHHLIPVCPEIFGGMPTPRDPAEQKDGLVITSKGENVTKEFQKGALEVLKLGKLYDCKLAILKERSPSCGCQKIYDGNFDGTIIEGNGVTAELLLTHGIKVIGESECVEFIKSKML